MLFRLCLYRNRLPEVFESIKTLKRQKLHHYLHNHRFDKKEESLEQKVGKLEIKKRRMKSL